MNNDNIEIPFIDANVFLRFLVNDKISSHLRKKAQGIFRKIHDQTLTVQTTYIIIAEIIYVLESFYKRNKQDIAVMINSLLQSNNILIDQKENLIQALVYYWENNVDFEDAHTYVTMQQNQMYKIYTFDIAHFKKLPDVKILNI